MRAVHPAPRVALRRYQERPLPDFEDVHARVPRGGLDGGPVVARVGTRPIYVVVRHAARILPVLGGKEALVPVPVMGVEVDRVRLPPYHFAAPVERAAKGVGVLADVTDEPV